MTQSWLLICECIACSDSVIPTYLAILTNFDSLCKVLDWFSSRTLLLSSPVGSKWRSHNRYIYSLVSDSQRSSLQDNQRVTMCTRLPLSLAFNDELYRKASEAKQSNNATLCLVRIARSFYFKVSQIQAVRITATRLRLPSFCLRSRVRPTATHSTTEKER